METKWLKEALFAGMTANAFKLGTVLTLGWFWPRVAGCSALYRGDNMETIEFADVLAVAGINAGEISPPGYVPHDNGSDYFYVVRRVNNCGDEEYTLSAAVRVSIDADGELAQPQPNSIFEVRAEQTKPNKIRLVWFYCPVEQQSGPACFNVYCDSGTGQINYENPVATIRYAGRRFYSYQSESLEADTYLFAIRAEDAGGVENSSLARIRVQLDTTAPGAISILSAEAV